MNAGPIAISWATSDLRIHAVDVDTGADTFLGEPGAIGGAFLYNLTWDAANNRLLGINQNTNSVIAIDYATLIDGNPLTNPVTTLFSTGVSGAFWSGTDINPLTGKIYTIDEIQGSLYEIDLANSQLVLVDDYSTTMAGLTISPTGQFLAMQYGNPNLLQLNVGSGTFTSLFNTGFNTVIGMDFSADGRLIATADNNNRTLLEIDLTNSTATALVTGPMPRYDGFTFQTGALAAVVPEPTSLTICLAGIIGGIGFRLRRRQQTGA